MAPDELTGAATPATSPGGPAGGAESCCHAPCSGSAKKSNSFCAISGFRSLAATFSFLSRAETYNQGKFTDEDGREICGSVMYAAWGGTSMRSWCSGVINKAEDRSAITGAVKKGLKKKAEDHNKSVDSATKKTSVRTLSTVFRRGVGAYKTNPGSVRPNVKGPEQWAYARVNSYLYALKNEKFRSGKHDTDLFPKGHPLSSK